MSRSGRDDDSDFTATAAQYSHSPLPVGGAALSEKEGGHPLFLWLITFPCDVYGIYHPRHGIISLVLQSDTVGGEGLWQKL